MVYTGIYHHQYELSCGWETLIVAALNRSLRSPLDRTKRHLRETFVPQNFLAESNISEQKVHCFPKAKELSKSLKV